MKRLPLPDIVYIILLGISIFIVVLIPSLLTNTILISCLLLWAASGRPTSDKRLFWPVHLLIGGAFSLFTLHHLYNPSKEVFTNVDHHILSFIGYETPKDTICLIGDNSGQPLWDSKDLGGTVNIVRHEQELVLEYETSQPIYQKLTEIRDSLINGDQLPAFDHSFTLTFSGDSLAISVAINDIRNTTAWYNKLFGLQKKDSCHVEIEFFKNGKSLAKSTGSFHQFIRRSLPLYDMINDIPFPEEFTLEPYTFQGITLLRDISGAKIDDITLGHFHLAFSPIALTAVSSLTTNGKTIDINSQQWKGQINMSEDAAFKIGTGLYSTPYLCPQIQDNKLCAKADKPLRQKLPLDRDSLDNVQTAIITSSFEDLASSPTSLALHYPVFSQLSNEQQFYLATEYLPEGTLVPLTCKIVPLSNDDIVKKGSSDDDLISAGESFSLVNENRNVSPLFKFENLRNTVPFSSTKGYLLIIAVLLGAFISMSISMFIPSKSIDGSKIETRGETLVWLFLMALLSFRSFLAWRVSVFPPLEGFSETSFGTYTQDKYTFLYTMIGVFFFTLFLGICKVAKLRQWNYKKWLFPSWDYRLLLDNFKSNLRVGVTLAIIFLALFFLSANYERIRCVFAPVFVFYCLELWYSHVGDGNKNVKFKRLFWRYFIMMICVAWALYMDAGFGIVFVLFLLLYFALETYLNWKKDGDGNVQLLWPVVVLVVMFVVFILSGVYLVPLLYNYFIFISIIIVILFCLGTWYYWRKWEENGISTKWRLAPIILLGLAVIGFVFGGKSYLDSHRHLLYRSEVHIKSVDSILMDEKVNTRDMERLFQASQNRWYLDYYTQNKGEEILQPYQLREHFNKGISWHTQKTDAVMGRYVIGEHSIWSAYVLLLFFVIFLTGIFSSSIDDKESRPIKYGGPILLLCQAVFITMAVTNRFVFFGQDYPLISLDSALTVILTFTLLFFTVCGTLSEASGDDEYHYDRKPAYVVATILIIFFMFVRFLEGEPNKAFNVGEALNQAKQELAQINLQLIDFQRAKKDSLMSLGIRSDQKDLQSDFSAFINRFDHDYAISDSIIAQSKRRNSGMSPFTASMYLLYRNQLSKNNNATDIIHLRRHSDGNLEFGINNKYYRLTTPESNLETWQGNILPEKAISGFSLLSLHGSKDSLLSIGNESTRIDSGSGLTYEYPMYLAKVSAKWIPDGSDYYIVGRESQEVLVKQGTRQYRLTDASKASHYLAVHSGDYIETRAEEDKRTNSIFIKGEQDKYFARNMLINGRRMMIYPLAEKSFYPYHLAQMANAVLSGEDKTKRMRDITLSLSYPLMEDLFDNLNSFNEDLTTHARSVIVADGDGHIKAMVTTKNTAIPSGFVYVNPNDYDYVAKLRDRFYLTGDVVNEARALGDLNLAYLQPGPGSSIKPITFTAVMSQAYAEWQRYALYINPVEQKLETTLEEIKTKRYAGARLPFPSIYSDEVGVNGFTDIHRYIQKSSNYYNSLMVYLGYYEGKYISQEFNKAINNQYSGLFKQYSPTDTISNFPAFKIGDHLYAFRNWLTDDGMPRHENGALQVGFEKNFRLWKDEPGTLFTKDIHESVDLFEDPCFDDSLRIKFAFAYPAISYLPEKERITKQGTHDAIRNTTLGASPFQVTPLKMAEMYGKLFSQNRKFRLSLNPNYHSDAEPFIRDKTYEKDDLYEKTLSNHLFYGMADVPKSGTAATTIRKDGTRIIRLTELSESLSKNGYYMYAKTGTIGSALENTNTQLLAVVISKAKLDNISPDEFRKATNNHQFYVVYFLTEKNYHNYAVIRAAINTIVNSNVFKNYMNRKEDKK